VASYSDEDKIETLRRYLCNRQPVRESCAAVGCAMGSFARWRKDPDLVRKARALGPVDLPIEEGGTPDEAKIGPILAQLHAADADPPNPHQLSAEWLDRLCAAYAVTDDLDTLDDMMGWGRGVLAGWFEEVSDLPYDIEIHRAVRRMRMARALAQVALIEKVHQSKDWRAAKEALQARDPQRWDPKFRELDHGGDGIDLTDDQLLAIFAAKRPTPKILPPEDYAALKLGAGVEEGGA